MAYGITFGTKHSYTDWGLVPTEKPTINPPEVKTYYVDIPGADGQLDYTEQLGVVRYGMREFSVTFNLIRPRSEWESARSAIANYLHGKKLQVVFDEDPDYYYVARLQVGDFSAEGTNHATITINGIAEPFKYQSVTVSEDVSESATITLTNLVQQVQPTVTADADMTITLGETDIAIETGTATYDDLILEAGDNELTVTGTGTIIFAYTMGGI